MKKKSYLIFLICAAQNLSSADHRDNLANNATQIKAFAAYNYPTTKCGNCCLKLCAVSLAIATTAVPLSMYWLMKGHEFRK